ncbi:MAG: hypothetical protein IJV06_07305 [Bacteroidaceae bacterium]|nr:hypothetical protein [Bacteroidaceae bacterium]
MFYDGYFTLGTSLVDGINNIQATNEHIAHGEAVYDILGRRIFNTQFVRRGIYIKNGKKFMVP